MARYEFNEGSSSKFWEIKLDGKAFTTTYGKIGAAGQTTIKKFGSPAEAQKEHDKLVAEKTKKGYKAAGGKAATTPAKAASKAPAKLAKASGGGQYFEFVEGGSSKFWEITLAGATVKTRYGKIGSDGQQTVKDYKNAGEARSEHDKLVGEKTKKGYKLVRGDAATSGAPVATHAHNAKLEAAIAKDPDNADEYLVYADWLQGQGDPRGELIALQHGNKAAPAKKLLEQNKDHFWGKAAEFLDMLEAYEYGPLGANTTWRNGYLEKIWISNKHDRSSEFGSSEKPEADVAEVLGWVLDHPSAQFVRELTVGIVTFTENGYDGIAKVIAKRKLPTLRKLILGDFHSEETELNWSDAGKLDPIYASVPNLDSLTVRSGTMKLGTIALPNLRELTIISGGFDKGSLKSICAAKWPKLERLSIQLGSDTKFTLKDLQPIFDATAFPKVKHLGLGNSSIADLICTGLAGSRIANQLETLDLSLGTMSDAGATALASGKFSKLTTIDVSQNYLTTKGLAALKKLAKLEVLTKRRGWRGENGQRDDDGGDPDDRYIAAYE